MMENQLLVFFRRELNVFLGGWHTWVLLALQDVKSRYRRSVIGPFWITLTSIFYVAGLGLVYSRLFHLELREYLPYLSVGIITWTFIITLVTEGSNSIISAGHIIKQVNLPLTTHVLRIVFRNLIIFLHSYIILIPLLMWYGYLTLSGTIYSLVGIFVIMFALTPMAIALSILCARYRDVVPMVASVMQLLFFITPVMWHPNQIADLSIIIKYNVFNYLIDVVRAPMLLGSFPADSILVVVLTGSVFWVLALLALYSNRKNIPYWL